MKKIMLTGFRPTGKLHLGHLHGNIKNMIKHQHEYNNFFFLVDWHALSTEYQDPVNIKSNLIDCVIDLIALGIDPEITNIYRQSDISEIAELFLYLSMITPLPWLERCPTYKEQMKQIKSKDLSTLGFLSYPVLMAADINSECRHCPVGGSAAASGIREIARKFNFLYGNYFKEPVEMFQNNRFQELMEGKCPKVIIMQFLSDEPSGEESQQMITDPQRIHIRSR